MRQFLKILVKGALGLTAATAMVAAVQAQAAPIPDRASDSVRLTRGAVLGDRDGAQEWPAVAAPSGAFLLAQNVEPPKEKPVSPASSPKKAKARRSMPPPSQSERSAPESPMIPDEPERSGTKKIGGQTIRAKKPPEENSPSEASDGVSEGSNNGLEAMPVSLRA